RITIRRSTATSPAPPIGPHRASIAGSGMASTPPTGHAPAERPSRSCSRTLQPASESEWYVVRQSLTYVMSPPTGPASAGSPSRSRSRTSHSASESEWHFARQSLTYVTAWRQILDRIDRAPVSLAEKQELL